MNLIEQWRVGRRRPYGPPLPTGHCCHALLSNSSTADNSFSKISIYFTRFEKNAHHSNPFGKLTIALKILSKTSSAVQVTRRATLSPAEIEQQRILERERSAARRVAITEKEIEKQRALAAERMMNARAAASPRVAEEQRVQARNRSITRRATYSAEEAEQHLALARQKCSREKASKKTHLKQKQEQSQCAEVEWPTPADMERKTSCLENFIQQMSMSSLAQGVCGVCNIRCYKLNLRCVPVDQIPSIELLETHDDLRSIINATSRPQDLNLKKSDNVNGHVDPSGVPNLAG